MKKLLAIFLAALFVFSTATVFVSAASPKPLERDDKNIIKMDFLDFNAESNALWAEQDAEGKWSCFITADNWEYPQNEDEEPIAPYITSSYRGNTEFSFLENGEVLHFEVLGANDNPGLYFILDEVRNDIIPVGKETGDNPKAEYFKIRIRNSSTAAKFSFGWAMNHTNNGKFVNASVSDLKADMNGKEYKSATQEWETYIFSMPTINQATNYNDDLPKDDDGNPLTRWGGFMYDLLLFPFGFGVEDGTGPYVGASIDIDYIVMGSLDYVTNYKSELEIKESTITNLELVNTPAKRDYYVGDEIDITGLEIKATYQNGETEIFTNLTPRAKLEAEAASTPVTFKFGSQAVTYDVKVTGVQDIKIIKTPESTTYEASELTGAFGGDGYEFQITYTDGTVRSSNELPAKSIRFFSDDDLTTPGTKTMTANFYGNTVDFNIEVVAVSDIEIASPEKTYRYNGAVSTDDFAVTLVYNNGDKVASADSATTFEYAIEVNNKAAGEVTAKITATNTDLNLTFVKEVPVTFEMPTALVVKKAPSKTSYQPGEAFDPAGLQVALKYEDGTTIDLLSDDFTATASTFDPGDKRVSIKCTVEGLDRLKVEEPCIIKVEGEVAQNTTKAPDNTTKAPQGNNSSGGINPVVIIVIIVAVVAVAGVAVVLVVLKKKKK